MIEPDIIDCEQGSPEWFAARLGLPTASRFNEVLREEGRGAGGESKTRRTYLNQLAGERITGVPMETWKNAAMERGHVDEPEALQQYEFLTGHTVQRVGFIRGYRCGCSPDGLIGDDGMVEFKSTEPHLLIDIWRRRLPPTMHYAQCQGGLMVARRKWIDLAIYCKGLPLFIHRFDKDVSFIEHLEGQVHIFNKEVDQIVELIRGVT